MWIYPILGGVRCTICLHRERGQVLIRDFAGVPVDNHGAIRYEAEAFLRRLPPGSKLDGFLIKGEFHIVDFQCEVASRTFSQRQALIRDIGNVLEPCFIIRAPVMSVSESEVDEYRAAFKEWGHVECAIVYN